jgi:hypothetical protein
VRLATCRYEGDSDCSHEQQPDSHFCTAHAHTVEMTLGLLTVESPRPPPTVGPPPPGRAGPASAGPARTVPVVATEPVREPREPDSASGEAAREPGEDAPVDGVPRMLRVVVTVATAVVAAVVALLVILWLG